MNWQFFPYFIPYILSLSISTAIGIYALGRRRVVGAVALGLFALGQASWTLGYIFELADPTLEGKIFWDNFQFIGWIAAPLLLLWFSLQFTGRKLRHPRLVWGFLFLLSAVSLLLIYTDPWHGALRPAAWLIAGAPFDLLYYDFSLLFWAMAIYSYAVVLYCLGQLLDQYRRAHQPFRAQTGIIIIGILIPMITTFLTMLGFSLEGQRDFTPVTFAAGNLVIAWGLFRYQLLDVVPIARDLLIESLDDYVIVLDAQNRIVDLNTSAARVQSQPAAAIIGQPAAEIYASWPDLLAQFRRKQVRRSEFTIAFADEPRHYDLRISPILSRRRRLLGRVFLVRDITARVRAEQALQERTAELEAANAELAVANEHLRELSRAKDEFVSNVSHELRTPITTIKLLLELLARRPDRLGEYLDPIARESDRLEDLIEGLLLLSRLDQGRATITPLECDLNQLAAHLVTDRAPLAESRALTLRFLPGESLPPVLGDSGMLAQVLSILLTNAFNYTPAGGEITVQTAAQVNGSGQWAGFSVADTGPGISAEDQAQLFNRFFRGDAGLDSGVSGTGLGLAIAHEIVTRHQGRIDVQSAGIPGEGATFFVWLPVEPESAGQPAPIP